MKELYTAPELNVLYMVAQESIADKGNVDFDDMLDGATDPVSNQEPVLGDIDVTLP